MLRKLLVLAALLGLAACAGLGLKKPDISLADIKPVSASLLEQSFDVTLRLQNPNNLPLSADGLQFDLLLAGNKLATGVSNQPIKVAALADTTFTVRVHTSLTGWLKQVGKLMDGNTRQLDYQINGRLEGLNGFGSLPFTSKGEWKLPQ
ncbi:LEA type 2 family protein [uncultured Aquitalea sp.]|uniref:LEA type 2 family protein n=1 Tax=uncultured Aquitalea sp. TaxID=540272 RepID=UPI0025E3D756|nr:LEA type 2 family protein [uncultured Aquitalea sp.]